jgi:hypothetical protein
MANTKNNFKLNGDPRYETYDDPTDAANAWENK